MHLVIGKQSSFFGRKVRSVFRTSKMELFAKIVNYFCKKLDLRGLTGFRIRFCQSELRVLSALAGFLPKELKPFGRREISLAIS